MPRPAGQTRRRILDSAYELFYRKGFSRVGVDEIAAFAGITKRTLYYHFRARMNSWRRCWTSSTNWRSHAFGSTRLVIAESRMTYSMCCSPNLPDGWHGLGLPERVLHASSWNLLICPATRACRCTSSQVRGRRLVHRVVCQREGVSPGELARDVALLTEGAMALALVHRDRTYVMAAARVAKRLVRSTHR